LPADTTTVRYDSPPAIESKYARASAVPTLESMLTLTLMMSESPVVAAQSAALITFSSRVLPAPVTPLALETIKAPGAIPVWTES
jgi:hypothetical protein